MCFSSEVIANVLVLTQLRYAAHGVSFVVVSGENNCHCDGWDWG